MPSSVLRGLKKKIDVRRNIVAADKKRQTLLLHSIARNRVYDGNEAEELAGLLFL